MKVTQGNKIFWEVPLGLWLRRVWCGASQGERDQTLLQLYINLIIIEMSSRHGLQIPLKELDMSLRIYKYFYIHTLLFLPANKTVSLKKRCGKLKCFCKLGSDLTHFFLNLTWNSRCSTWSPCAPGQNRNLTCPSALMSESGWKLLVGWLYLNWLGSPWLNKYILCTSGKVWYLLRKGDWSDCLRSSTTWLSPPGITVHQWMTFPLSRHQQTMNCECTCAPPSLCLPQASALQSPRPPWSASSHPPSMVPMAILLSQALLHFSHLVRSLLSLFK